MSVAASITSALQRFGRPMTLRRLTWSGDTATAADVTVFGVTEGYLSVELSDGQSASGAAKATFSDAQIVAAGWPGPPQPLDEIIIDGGQPRTVMAVETKYLGAQVLVHVAEVQALNFDRQITIERATNAEDEYGGVTKTWVPIATVEASKVDISGDEDFRAAQIVATVVARFRVRWISTLSDLNPTDRIICDGRVYEIKAVKELQFKVGWEILTITNLQ